MVFALSSEPNRLAIQRDLPATTSKRLPQSDEYVSRSQPGHGTQVVTDINSHRTYGGFVAQAETDCAAVMAEEIVEVDVLIYVASVIEKHTPQSLLDWYGEASF